MIRSHLPKLEDLWFLQTMLEDPETMSYNHAYGGTLSFPKDKWEGRYDYWILNHDNKRYYRYLMDNSERFVGEIAYHYEETRGIYLADIKIYSPYRRQGFASKGLDLLCGAAKAKGISVLYDDIAIDNSAIDLFLKHGFVEEYRTDEYIMVKKQLV